MLYLAGGFFFAGADRRYNFDRSADELDSYGTGIFLMVQSCNTAD